MTSGNSTGKTIKDGTNVRAIGRITEGGCGYVGDKDVALADEEGRINAEYIHAEPGETGVVDDIIDDGVVYVHFHRTGTGSIVSVDEVEPLPPSPDPNTTVPAAVGSRKTAAAAPPAVP